MKYSQRSLIGRVEREIKKYSLIEPGDRIMVALSGGPDSVCLFDILAKIKNNIAFELSACHYNHKMRGEESDHDEEFVKKFCSERGIECHVGEAGGKIKSEEEARRARYAFFEKILRDNRGAKIALAHNADDLSETVILRLIRGAGLRGLRGIPRQRKDFIRPLLSVFRADIITYLNENSLKYRVDKSNEDVRYTRNFLRLKVLPLFSQVNPNFAETLVRTAEVIEDDYNYLVNEARKAQKDVLICSVAGRVELDHKAWMKLHKSIQRLVLRLSLEDLSDLVDITVNQLAEVCDLLEKGVGRKVKLLPHSLRIELVSGKIILVRDPDGHE